LKIYNLQLDLFILTPLVYSAELLTDFNYTNFTLSYRDALDRFRAHLNIIVLLIQLQLTNNTTQNTNRQHVLKNSFVLCEDNLLYSRSFLEGFFMPRLWYWQTKQKTKKNTQKKKS